ncbi:hypothetical protein MHBO_001985 [Bonamia ostreae]|uniref:CSD domain-containing protein n=1 Tax=Bonamia ostreae TaxID=126728 RepID=A0ABV2AKU4_9EUKA
MSLPKKSAKIDENHKSLFEEKFVNKSTNPFLKCSSNVANGQSKKSGQLLENDKKNEIVFEVEKLIGQFIDNNKQLERPSKYNDADNADKNFTKNRKIAKNENFLQKMNDLCITKIQNLKKVEEHFKTQKINEDVNRENGFQKEPKEGESSDSFDETVRKQKGKVIWFCPRKGYGFIRTKGRDLFVHHSGILGLGFKILKYGENVEFEVVTDRDGKKRAINVTGPDGIELDGFTTFIIKL